MNHTFSNSKILLILTTLLLLLPQASSIKFPIIIGGSTGDTVIEQMRYSSSDDSFIVAGYSNDPNLMNQRTPGIPDSRFVIKLSLNRDYFEWAKSLSVIPINA